MTVSKMCSVPALRGKEFFDVDMLCFEFRSNFIITSFFERKPPIMSKPRTLIEQMRTRRFEADHHIAVYYETSKFDRVHYINPYTGQVEQRMENMANWCKKDIKRMKKVLERFKFT